MRTLYLLNAAFLRSAAALSAALSVFVVVQASNASAAGPVEADDVSYYNEVVRSELPVILEFYANWCPACKKVGPAVSGLASRLSGRVKVVKMNVDRSQTTASRYKVKSIPAFFYVDDGSVLGETVGAMSGDELLDELGVPVE